VRAAPSIAAESPSLAQQLVRFAVVGVSNTALSWSLYALGVKLGVWYPVAAAASFAVGAINGYTLNRVWTFRAGEFSAGRLARYVCVQAGALSANVVVLVVLVELAGVPRLPGQFVALAVVSVLNFTATRRFAFAVAGGGSVVRSVPWELGLRALATLAVGALVAAAVASVLVVSAKRSFLSPPSRAAFPDWLAGPWHGAGLSVPQTSWSLMWVFGAVVGAMLLCYVAVVVLSRWLPAPVAIAGVVALHAIFLLGPPFPLTDVFNYLGYARLGVVHHLNPFVNAPIAAKHDAAYRFATWHHLPTPYGPLFTAASYALVPLGIVKGYWALKALTVVASLGCLALVWRCARALDRPPLPALAFVAFNPLLLVGGLGGFHNDFFMMLLVLGAVLLAIRGRSALGGAMSSAAAVVKVAAGVFVPFVLLGSRRRAVALAGAVGTGAVLLAAAVALFGTHDPGLSDQAKRIVGPYSVPSELGLVFGFGVDATTRHVVAAVLIVTVAVLLVRVWRGADWIVSAGWAAIALAVAQVQPMPWYIVWALPFAALGRSRALRIAVVGVGVVLLVDSSPIQNVLLAHTLHLRGVGHPSDHATRALLH
jgi:putative flippase GtrA